MYKRQLKWYFDHHKIEYRYLLTATPYRSSAMDVRVMLELLGHKINKTEFFNRFFSMVRMGRRMVPLQINSKEKDEEILALIKSVGSVVALEECFDVPEQLYYPIYLELTTEQRQAMEDSFDPMPIINFTRQHQICGGTLKGDEYTETKHYQSNKLERLRSLLADNSKAIVVCRYNAELYHLKEQLNKPCLLYTSPSPRD